MNLGHFFNMAYIYQITSKLNSKKYIGSAYNFENRKYKHLWCLKNQKHPNIHLQHHYNLYENDLIFEILEEDIPNDILYTIEQLYLDNLFNSVDRELIFNMSASSEHPTVKGWLHTDEWKLKQSERRSGTIHSDEAKQKMSNILKERWMNDSVYRAKMSNSAKKRPSNRKGAILSEETKLKISKSKKGKPLSDETKLKMKGRIPWNKKIE